MPERPVYAVDFDHILQLPGIWERTDRYGLGYLQPVLTMSQAMSGRPFLANEPVNFFSSAEGAQIINASTSATYQPRTARFPRLVRPDWTPPPPSGPEDVLRGNRWCSSSGVAQLGIRTGRRVFPQRLTLDLAPTGRRPPDARLGFVEVWARISDLRHRARINLAINQGLLAVSPKQSLLGTNSFGMGHDYYRIAFFVVPALSDSEWRRGVAAGPDPGIDISIDLASIGADASDFVIRATLDGPAVCFVGLGLRARTSTLLKKNIADWI
jgi:hypothetical protein